MSWIKEHCPRLALAHRQYRRLAVKRQDDLLQLERLVAHRELQFARACSRPGKNGRYLAERSRKLREAQASLERVRRRPIAG